MVACGSSAWAAQHHDTRHRLSPPTGCRLDLEARTSLYWRCGNVVTLGISRQDVPRQITPSKSAPSYATARRALQTHCHSPHHLCQSFKHLRHTSLPTTSTAPTGHSRRRWADSARSRYGHVAITVPALRFYPSGAILAEDDHALPSRSRLICRRLMARSGSKYLRLLIRAKSPKFCSPSSLKPASRSGWIRRPIPMTTAHTIGLGTIADRY